MSEYQCGICGYTHVAPNRSRYDCISGMREIIQSKDWHIAELEKRLAFAESTIVQARDLIKEESPVSAIQSQTIESLLNYIKELKASISGCAFCKGAYVSLPEDTCNE